MGDQPGKDRHSAPLRGNPLPPLTEEEKARQEALNAYLQSGRMNELIDETYDSNAPFRLRPHVIQELNRISIHMIEPDAGRWRDVPMRIGESKHRPPPPEEVPRYIDELCEYVNDNWETKSPLHLAAYVMWRLNWIHPFIDGNGRTTRAVSYYVLCAKLGFRIPGVTTIPELVARSKGPYYKALEAADARYTDGVIGVDAMESLLKNLLAAQMVEAIERAASVAKTPKRQGRRMPSSSAGQIESNPPKATITFSLKTGAAFGALALLFFMGLTILSIIGYQIPSSAKYLIVIVLSLSAALASHYIGGHAIARGSIPFPQVQEHPLRYSVAGGVAVMILLLILGSMLFL